MRYVLDTNIVLDALCKREPFDSEARALLKEVAAGNVDASITSNSVTDTYYFVRKAFKDADQARAKLQTLLNLLPIIDLTGAQCRAAFGSPVKDYEDAALVECAKDNGCDCIITRNTRDFSHAPILVCSPAEALTTYEIVDLPEN